MNCKNAQGTKRMRATGSCGLISPASRRFPSVRHSEHRYTLITPGKTISSLSSLPNYPLAAEWPGATWTVRETNVRSHGWGKLVWLMVLSARGRTPPSPPIPPPSLVPPLPVWSPKPATCLTHYYLLPHSRCPVIYSNHLPCSLHPSASFFTSALEPSQSIPYFDYPSQPFSPTLHIPTLYLIVLSCCPTHFLFLYAPSRLLKTVLAPWGFRYYGVVLSCLSFIRPGSVFSTFAFTSLFVDGDV